jgi:hypothetical protein
MYLCVYFTYRFSFLLKSDFFSKLKILNNFQMFLFFKKAQFYQNKRLFSHVSFQLVWLLFLAVQPHYFTVCLIKLDKSSCLLSVYKPLSTKKIFLKRWNSFSFDLANKKQNHVFRNFFYLCFKITPNCNDIIRNV